MDILMMKLLIPSSKKMIYESLIPIIRLAMCIRDFFVLIDVLIMSSDSIFLIKINYD